MRRGLWEREIMQREKNYKPFEAPWEKREREAVEKRMQAEEKKRQDSAAMCCQRIGGRWECSGKRPGNENN